MKLSKIEKIILSVNLLLIIFFGTRFLSPINYEFLIYIGVIIFFLILILVTRKKINYPPLLLWSLTAWSFLHMAGGALTWNGVIWYKQILLPLAGEPYNILRYDQVIHMFGFFTATVLSYYLLRPLLKDPKNLKGSLMLIMVMAGCGFGALNEVIEFLVDTSIPESGVGGYINTSLDLVSNLIGSCIAALVIYCIERKKQ